MKIILVEFPWHAQEINKDRAFFKKDIIISLDPESSYILKANKIPYFETYQFCNHKELWFRYRAITDHSIKVTQLLDEALWKIDNRFEELDWKFFNDYYHTLKTSFDQLYYYSELISKLINKFKPSEIVVADSSKILITELFRISSKISVIKHLIKSSEDIFDKIKISFVKPPQNKKFTKLNFFIIKNLFKKKIKNIFYKINFLINYHLSKPKYLSINCYEILKYKKLYPDESKFFLSYFKRGQDSTSDVQLGYFSKKYSNFFKQFINYLKNETNFYELIKNKNISFQLIFDEILFKLIKQLDFSIAEYHKARRIIKKIKPLCVIFQSMQPLHSSNITFRKACIDLKIPYATWSHGGYGLTYSLAAYDATDFKFCKNHISYGIHLRDLIENNNCILRQLKLHKYHQILPVGSPRFDYDNKKRKLKKILKTNNKQTIVFLLGCSLNRNQFYFGRNREKSETSLWEFHYDILCLLKKYQNKYNIIFKDTPIGKKTLWKSVLKDIGANKILYVSNEYTVNDLLRISDLNIMPWLSTTFFEALHFDADIFFLEEDMFEEPFKEQLKNEIFYFKDADKLKNQLTQYLEEGKFYKYKKNQSRKYFLNFDYIHKRDKMLNQALHNISNN